MEAESIAPAVSPTVTAGANNYANACDPTKLDLFEDSKFVSKQCTPI